MMWGVVGLMLGAFIAVILTLSGVMMMLDETTRSIEAWIALAIFTMTMAGTAVMATWTAQDIHAERKWWNQIYGED